MYLSDIYSLFVAHILTGSANAGVSRNCGYALCSVGAAAVPLLLHAMTSAALERTRARAAFHLGDMGYTVFMAYLDTHHITHVRRRHALTPAAHAGDMGFVRMPIHIHC